MRRPRKSLRPADAERRIVEELEAHGLPAFESAEHDPEINMLVVTWAHGPVLLFDLALGAIEPFDEAICQEIVGLHHLPGPIDICVPGSADDPRTPTEVPGVRIHHVPEMHPDDMAVVRGIPCTSPSRTLIDLAEVMPKDELRDVFARARDIGLLDADARRASRDRVEWRPSLAMLDEVIEEFCG